MQSFAVSRHGKSKRVRLNKKEAREAKFTGWAGRWMISTVSRTTNFVRDLAGPFRTKREGTALLGKINSYGEQ